MKHNILFLFASLSLNTFAQDQRAPMTKDQGRLPIFSDSFKSHPISNFKAYLSYESMKEETLSFSSGHSIKMPMGEHTLSVIYENPHAGKFSIRASLDGFVHEVIAPEKKARSFIKPKFDLDFTVWTQFQTKDGGTVFANCASNGPWSTGGKALLVRGQVLV